MEATTSTLLILVAVVSSSAISRAIPFSAPLPFVQIALGALIALVFDTTVSLEPEMFMLLFIAPLLFLDGWRIPREGLFRDKWIIGALAFGLVFFTVVGAGYFIHWMIPAMPLSVAFALAAVVSPTDAVGVSAIASKAPLPRRLMHILEGESLLNDASGLVCLKFAVAAGATGSFSMLRAGSAFAWLALGGIGTGLAVSLLANAAKDWVAQRFGEETGAQILTSLLIPFSAYVLAEHIHASGILAAVAAGLAMSYEERAGRASALTRIRRTAVWDALQFAGSGTIFVLLGHQLPEIVRGANKALGETGHQGEFWLLIYVLAIGCVIAGFRAVWTWATLGLILFRRTHSRGEIQASSSRIIAVMTLAGVRGAVSLSGIMTLPLILQDGSAFPTRDLAILLAAGTIVLSLIVAQIGLPRAAKGLQLPLDTLGKQEGDARLAAAHAAIRAVERVISQEDDRETLEACMQVGARITARYRQRIEATSEAGDDIFCTQRLERVEQRLLLVALHAERNEFYRISRSGGLPDDVARNLVRDIDLQESRLRLR